MQAYLGLGKEFAETWQPQGAYEARLVQTLTSQTWRLQRCASLENAMFALGHAAFGDKPARASSGIPDPEDAAIHATLTAARSFMENPRALESLSKHEFRINRLDQNTLKELRQVQSMRKAQGEADLHRAAKLYQTAKMKGLQYNPPDDGFVLTNSEIEQYIAQTDRRIVAAIAERSGFNLKKFQEAMAA